MGRTVNRTSDGDIESIEAGESATITATFTDTTGADLTTSAIQTMTATLLNASTGAVINSRNAQDILNANGGAVADSNGKATLTLKLSPADNANIGTPAGDLEEHYLLVTWTWNDTDAVTQTGKHEWLLYIRPLTTPV